MMASSDWTVNSTIDHKGQKAFKNIVWHLVAITWTTKLAPYHLGMVLQLNRMAWQWAETPVEIRGTLSDIRGTTK